MQTLIRSTICKHMHLVARLCAQTSCNSVQPSVQEMEYQQETLLANLKSDKVATGLKERVKRALTELTAQISSCDDDELITAAEKHIKMAQNIIKATKSCATFLPPNQSHQTNKLQNKGHSSLQRSKYIPPLAWQSQHMNKKATYHRRCWKDGTALNVKCSAQTWT